MAASLRSDMPRVRQVEETYSWIVLREEAKPAQLFNFKLRIFPAPVNRLRDELSFKKLQRHVFKSAADARIHEFLH